MAATDSNRQIISRKEARRLGLTHYFTGISCKHGHLEPRPTKCGQCLGCVRKRGAEYRNKYPERSLELGRARDQKRRGTTGGKRLRSAQRRGLYAKNSAQTRAELREKQHLNYVKHIEKRRAYNKRYYQNNKDRMRVRGRNYDAKKRGNGGRHTAKDISEIMEAQHGKCAYCRKIVGKKYHVDHIRSVAKGGTNDRRNLQILCPSCNLHKRTSDPIDFARTLGMLL